MQKVISHNSPIPLADTDWFILSLYLTFYLLLAARNLATHDISSGVIQSTKAMVSLELSICTLLAIWRATPSPTLTQSSSFSAMPSSKSIVFENQVNPYNGFRDFTVNLECISYIESIRILTESLFSNLDLSEVKIPNVGQKLRRCHGDVPSRYCTCFRQDPLHFNTLLFIYISSWLIIIM